MTSRLVALVVALAIGAATPAGAKPRFIVNSDLADEIMQSAKRLGISPLDLGTAISYETAGTFSPRIRGPVTQHGRHIGLIQMGEPQREEFGYDPKGSTREQMAAVEAYLKNAGVEPGHGLKDIYSAINAGRVGRYNASDAGNGGAPGTVLDKVRNQMSGHRQKAAALLEGRLTPDMDTADAGASTQTTEASYEEMLRHLSEPTNDPRRLAIREVAAPLLADLSPPDGQGQAVALGGDSGQPAGLGVLQSLLGQSASPATNPQEPA